MGDLARDYDFTAGQPIKSSEVDSELNKLFAGHNAQEDALEILAAYRTLTEAFGQISGASVAGDYPLSFGGFSPLEGADGQNPLHMFYLDDADFTVTGKTPKLRVRAQCITNGFAPGITLTAKLFPVTAGAGNSLNLGEILGAAVAGSSVAFALPPSASLREGNSGDFSYPGDGYYALGVTLSGTHSANARTEIAAHLQQRWV